MSTTTAPVATTDNRFIAYLADYASYHRTKGNKLTHHVGIPIIVLAIAGLLAKVQFGPSFAGGWLAWDLGFVAGLAVTVWYLYLDWKIGLPSSVVLLAVYVLGKPIPVVWLIALFVVGWIIQFIGHVRYEHNRPAFFKNLEHLLIGPVWIFGTWFRYLPSIPATSPR